jgi:hypothetical protein
MKGKARPGLADPQRRPHVLHEHGVHAGLGHGRDRPVEVLPLVGEHERVERGVAAEAPPVERLHEPRQVGELKIRGPGPGVEAGVEAEVDGVGAVFDRRTDAVPITGGGEEFGC